MINQDQLNIEREIPLYPSFSAVFFPFYYILLMFDIFIIYFFNLLLQTVYLTPFQMSNLIIFNIVFTQIILFPLWLTLLPKYQKIVLNKNSLLVSFSHKILFVLSSPILVLGLFCAAYIKRLFNFLNFQFISFIYDFSSLLLLVIIWGVFIQLIWQYLTEAFDIHTSKRINKQFLIKSQILGIDNDLIEFIRNIEQIKSGINISVSNRWKIILIEIPIILGVLGFTLFQNSKIITYLLIVDTYLFFFLFFLITYRRLIFKNRNVKKIIDIIYKKIFGVYDISDGVQNDSLFLSGAILFLYLISYVAIKNYFKIISIFLFLILIINFILTIWSVSIFRTSELFEPQTRTLLHQLKILTETANNEKSSFSKVITSNQFRFTYNDLIRKILPSPFDTNNWVIFSFKNHLFNPLVLEQLANLLDIEFNLQDYFSSALIDGIKELKLQPYDQFPSDRKIYDRLVSLYDFNVSIFPFKSNNKIFFFNFKNCFFLCNHSLHPLMVDKFMLYFDNILKKKLASAKKVELNEISPTTFDPTNDLIYWNLTDVFLNKIMNQNSRFIIDQNLKRREFFNSRKL